MSFWSQILLQESNSPTMQLLTLFHDYSLSIILMIVFFVMGVSLYMVTNKMISNSPIMTIIEVVWTILPMGVLILLAIPSLQILYYMEETDPFLTMKILGNQWYWNYEIVDLNLEFDSYMITSVDNGDYRLLDVDHRMVLPIDKEIRTLISATDVLHCWTIPSLGMKADAVPGRLNQLFFNILRPSIMYGQCSEICGANHSFMPITIESMNTQNFFEWVYQLMNWILLY